MNWLIGAVAAAGALAVAGGAQPAAAADAPRRCMPGAASYDIAIAGHPFAALPAPDEQHLFVSVSASNPAERTGIAVFACRAGRYAPTGFVSLEASPTGMAMTHDGKLLVVADDDHVAFVDVQRAIAGASGALAGYFKDLEDDDAGAVYANVSPDDRLLFVSDETNQTITVIDLARARTAGFSRAAIVGTIPTGNAPIALTFTKDGRYLLTTSQRARRTDNLAAACKPEGAPATAAVTNPPGQIIVVDVAKAATDPEHSVVAKVPAGCSPVRMALSADGTTAWVTARNSNAALGFSVAKLIAGDAATAQIAQLDAGAAPVPIAVTPDGRMLLVGNSNRFGQGARGNQVLNVYDAQAGAGGRAVPLGQITVGRFPRELTRTASGSLMFLANWDSNTVTVIDPARLRELIRPPS
jgi:DNA-binding beta-propeller fold protein YncE